MFCAPLEGCDSNWLDNRTFNTLRDTLLVFKTISIFHSICTMIEKTGSRASAERTLRSSMAASNFARAAFWISGSSQHTEEANLRIFCRKRLVSSLSVSRLSKPSSAMICKEKPFWTRWFTKCLHYSAMQSLWNRAIFSSFVNSCNRFFSKTQSDKNSSPFIGYFDLHVNYFHPEIRSPVNLNCILKISKCDKNLTPNH